MAERDGDRLGQRLAAIRARHPGSEPEMVADVVRAVVSTMRGDLTLKETSLLTVVETLGQTIARAKVDIAALEFDDITDRRIPCAADELDAIVEHTATATNVILTCCETLDNVAGSLTGDQAAVLKDVTTQIYEACGFQDITGQRITKVVATLKTIEEKVASIVATFGNGVAGEDAMLDCKPPDATLLNGPQHPAAAMDQSEIDRLLSTFE